MADGVMSAVVLSKRSFSRPWKGSLGSAHDIESQAYKSWPRPRSSNDVPGTTKGDTETSTCGETDATGGTTSMSGAGSAALSVS